MRTRDLPYRLGTWCGMVQYQCPHCAFDALDEETILEHLATRHEPVHNEAEGREMSGVLTADRWGNEVRR